MLKRTFGIVVAVFWDIISAPLALIIALAIKLESPGPFVRPSQRVGEPGRPSFYHRFRTRVGTPLT